MKKITILMISICILLLHGCLDKDFDGNMKTIAVDNYEEEINDAMLRDIKVGSTYQEVIEILGEPNTYYDRGGEEVSSDSLNKNFFMYYEGISLVMNEFTVTELRVESEKYRYDDKLYVGQDMDVALKLLSPPVDVITGEMTSFTYLVLFKNIIQFGDKTYSEDDEACYFNDPINGVRLFFYRGEVSAVYYYEYDLRHEKGEGFDLKYGLAGRVSGSGQFSSTTKNGVTYEFKDDESIRGSWKYIDLLIRSEDFDETAELTKFEFEDVIFNEKGEVDKSIYQWTNGYLINQYYDTVFKYKIIEDEYLVITPFDNDDTYLYVLKKVN